MRFYPKNIYMGGHCRDDSYQCRVELSIALLYEYLELHVIWFSVTMTNISKTFETDYKKVNNDRMV